MAGRPDRQDGRGDCRNRAPVESQDWRLRAARSDEGVGSRRVVPEKGVRPVVHGPAQWPTPLPRATGFLELTPRAGPGPVIYMSCCRELARTWVRTCRTMQLGPTQWPLCGPIALHGCGLVSERSPVG